MNQGLDIYSLKARLFPAFLVVLPVGLAITAFAPAAKWPEFSLLGVGVSAGFGFLLAELARDSGKAKQAELWASWGGSPTTQLLRHRNKAVNSNLREKWHKRLAELTGQALPSPGSEAKAPERADAAYEAVIFELREQQRSAEHGALFFKENVSYGFRRNLWGMKPAGIFLSALSLLVAVYCVAKQLTKTDAPIATDVWPASVATVWSATMLVLWILRINPKWVRLAAFEYAERLLGRLLDPVKSLP